MTKKKRARKVSGENPLGVPQWLIDGGIANARGRSQEHESRPGSIVGMDLELGPAFKNVPPGRMQEVLEGLVLRWLDEDAEARPELIYHFEGLVPGQEWNLDMGALEEAVLDVLRARTQHH